MEEPAKPAAAVLKKPPVLFKDTQKVIEQISKELDGDFLTYWISDSGNMIQEDVIALHGLLGTRVKRDTLYLYVKSDGGSGKSALRMIHLLRNYYKRIIALVPLGCASAATMLVLGADTVMMGPLAYLSAIDTSITHELSPIDQKYNNKVSVSQNELDRVLRLWDMKNEAKGDNPYSTLYKHIHPMVFGAVDRASSLSIKLTTEILSYHMADEVLAQRISQHLNSDYPSHGYPITSREAKKIGLNVVDLDEAVNTKLLSLNDLYSEMAQRAHTDYDEQHYHDNEILKILETEGEQIFYQNEKDWFYRTEERRYIEMNDESSWRRAELSNGRVRIKKFYIS
jgi:hypothetical protein